MEEGAQLGVGDPGFDVYHLAAESLNVSELQCSQLQNAEEKYIPHRLILRERR